jgi:hypothetical protein
MFSGVRSELDYRSDRSGLRRSTLKFCAKHRIDFAIVTIFMLLPLALPLGTSLV